MSFEDTHTLHTFPETMDDEGNVVPAQEHWLPRHSSASNVAELTEDHGDIAAKFDPSSEDPNPGPAIDLASRDKYLLETLEAASLAKKAQGRAVNHYNRGRIARNIGKLPQDVNPDGEAMLHEHLGHADRAFDKLMGYTALRAAGFDTTGMPTLNTFINTYFGSKQARANNAALRRQLKSRMGK